MGNSNFVFDIWTFYHHKSGADFRIDNIPTKNITKNILLVQNKLKRTIKILYLV